MVAAMYPENFLSNDSEFSEDKNWYVLYTKSRHEKAVAERLCAKSIAYYLPLVTKTSISRGRRFDSEIPLFSNYVFLHGTPDDRLAALQTNRISRILEVNEQQQFRFDLANIAQLIESNVAVTLEQRLEPGDRVRVKSGPLSGLEGLVIHRRKRSRLLIAVNCLQQGASVDIDDFILEPL